jgi:hypothetical protein
MNPLTGIRTSPRAEPVEVLMGTERHRRPDWLDRVRKILRLFVGFTGEIIRLINVIRSIR